MAGRPVDETPNYPASFQNKILVNLGYWNTYVKNYQADIAALERERERIITAIVFGLDLKRAWSVVFELITTFSSFMERQGKWETWQGVLKQAVVTAEQGGDKLGTTTLFALLARLSQRQSQLGQAIYFYRKAITMAREIHNIFEEARACSNLGFLFTEQGVWHRAEVLCCHALTLFEQLNNDHGRAHTANHLGLLYTRQHRWPQAQQHLERACVIWQVMEDHHGLMRGLINLGLLYNEMGRPGEALPCLEKALRQAAISGEEIEVGKIYMNMGITHRLKGVPTQAEACAQQAEIIFRRFSSLQGLAEVWHNLGLACMDQGKWEEAWLYLETARQSWRSMNHEYGEIRTLLYMVEYELVRGHYPQAITRLNELEQRHNENNWGERYLPLQALLAKHHRSLSESMSDQATADSNIND